MAVSKSKTGKFDAGWKAYFSGCKPRVSSGPEFLRGWCAAKQYAASRPEPKAQEARHE